MQVQLCVKEPVKQLLVQVLLLVKELQLPLLKIQLIGGVATEEPTEVVVLPLTLF